ncbi:S1/P1 nuclease [Qipengyuania spongiae]|uniref:S1/P1 nuclease n=1 Tax=Qipengyuania spongiae TaxID=2909673 RepID=A0ABY5SXY8_9SPHN|nr:S1/P1 nuclease [Qipengyuania spongiae]UVI39398.1 S1/P1 nuclease [Qipengyuania spongiae]
MGHRAIRNRGRLIALVLAALAALVPLPASAWGYYAHTVTGEIAQANVRPETRAGIARLLRAAPQLGTPDCPLATIGDAAVWPDCLRGEYWRWAYTFAWHYQTEPITEEYSDRKNCSGGSCVSAQITRNLRILADESLPDPVRLEALAFYIHFAGDIHMPLHSGDLDDRGGNDRTVAYGIAPGLNLHAIWDGPLAERAISEARPALVRRYTEAERAALGGGGPADWGRESWQLARDFVYPNAFDCGPCIDVPEETALTQEDIAAAVPVAERRVTQAGLRIAEGLDRAFAPGPLPGEEQE